MSKVLSVVAFCIIKAVIGRKGRSSMCTWERGNVNEHLWSRRKHL